METRSIVIMNWRDVRNPSAGGAEVFTHEVAKRWAAQGHAVSLVTSGFEGGAAEETLDGVRIIRRGGPLSAYRHARRVFLEEFRSRCDILIDEVNTRPFLTPKYAPGGVRLFALIHQLAREYWSYETPFPVSYVGRHWLEDRWLRPYVDVPTITVSASTKADLESLGFRHVEIVPEGLSATPLAAVPEKLGEPTLVYVARFKRVKLPDHALEAFRRIRERIPGARLWMVGDGYLLPAMRRRAPPGVAFLGHVSEEKKYELLRQAHLLLFPAVREGWGLTVIEANACGTPAIGYDVPGLRDSIVDGQTGFRVPFADVAAMADRAIWLLGHPAEYRAMASQALEGSRQFSWDRTAEAMMRIVAA